MPHPSELFARRERHARRWLEGDVLFGAAWWAAFIAFCVVTWLSVITLLF